MSSLLLKVRISISESLFACSLFSARTPHECAAEAVCARFERSPFGHIVRCVRITRTNSSNRGSLEPNASEEPESNVRLRIRNRRCMECGKECYSSCHSVTMWGGPTPRSAPHHNNKRTSPLCEKTQRCSDLLAGGEKGR